MSPRRGAPTGFPRSRRATYLHSTAGPAGKRLRTVLPSSLLQGPVAPLARPEPARQGPRLLFPDLLFPFQYDADSPTHGHNLATARQQAAVVDALGDAQDDCWDGSGVRNGRNCCRSHNGCPVASDLGHRPQLPRRLQPDPAADRSLVEHPVPPVCPRTSGPEPAGLIPPHPPRPPRDAGHKRSWPPKAGKGRPGSAGCRQNIETIVAGSRLISRR